MLQVELETALNTLKATQHMEHLRATNLAQSTVEAEAIVKKAGAFAWHAPAAAHIPHRLMAFISALCGC